MQKKKRFYKLGFASLGLCAACCALPAIGIALGIGSLATATYYLEKFTVGFMILVGLYVSFYIYKGSPKRAYCGAKCACPNNPPKH